MPAIFLSYARDDAKLAQALVRDLRDLGSTVWLDEETSGGQDWWNLILEQIRACDVFVYALSQASLDSLACTRELTYAVALGKPVLPIWVASDELRRRAPSTLAKIQYVDYRARTSETSLRLARALNHLPPASSLPEPLPEQPEAPPANMDQFAALISGDAPLNAEMQSHLARELKRNLTDTSLTKDVREQLARLRNRPDLLARIAQEIDEIWRVTRPNSWRTVLLTIGITVICLGLAAFAFRDALLALVSQERNQAFLTLDTQYNALQQEVDELRKNELELQAKIDKSEEYIKTIENQRLDNKSALKKALADVQTSQMFRTQYDVLKKERDSLHQHVSTLQTRINAANKRVEAMEAEHIQDQKALREEKATRGRLRKERDKLRARVSALEAKLKTNETRTPKKPTSDLPKSYTNSIGMKFVLIPHGTFEMGSNNGPDNEKPMHRVTLSQPFYLGKYEVTQAQWQAVMGKNPSENTGDPSLPVEKVSWNDVQDFIKKLNAKEGGNAYRLPTEAEWEYAARAGTTTVYSFGDDPGLLKEYGWYDDNSGRKTHPIGRLKANPWGLYDMHGNVLEWVADWYVSYLPDHQTDPKSSPNGSSRVVRGGSFGDSPELLRSTRRAGVGPVGRYWIIGFRCVRVPPGLNP